MTTIPSIVRSTKLHQLLSGSGLERIHQGKVRDTYNLEDGKLLVVASDRVSIFDFVLACGIEDKGEILTAMTVFWLTQHLKDIEHHLVAWGAGINKYLPEPLKGNQELQRRALVIQHLRMFEYEFIVRGMLTGSGWREYQETGRLGETELPRGLHDGSELPRLIFDPSTKAQTGHDERIPVSTVIEAVGQWAPVLTIKIFTGMTRAAEEVGMKLPDTKFEFGMEMGNEARGPVLADEIGTPDSSRFWDRMDWIRCSGHRISPPSFDKELVRDWGKGVNTGIIGEDGGAIMGMHDKRIDPANPKHTAKIHELCPPGDLLQLTKNRYHEVFGKFTGMNLSEFQRREMGIGGAS